MPPKAGDSLKQGTSVSLTTSSHSASSLLQEETLLKKCPNIYNQEKFCDKRVKFVKNKTSTATSASSAPDYYNPNLHLAALEALQRSGAIEMIYSTGGKGKVVIPATSVTTTTEN